MTVSSRRISNWLPSKKRAFKVREGSQRVDKLDKLLAAAKAENLQLKSQVQEWKLQIDELERQLMNSEGENNELRSQVQEANH